MLETSISRAWKGGGLSRDGGGHWGCEWWVVGPVGCPPACKCQWRDRKAVPLPVTSMGGGGEGGGDSIISALMVVALRCVSRGKAAVVQLPTCLYLLLVLACERKTALKNTASEEIRWSTADSGMPLKQTHGDLVRAVSGLCPSSPTPTPRAVMAIAAFPCLPRFSGGCPGASHREQRLCSEFTFWT